VDTGDIRPSNAAPVCGLPGAAEAPQFSVDERGVPRVGSVSGLTQWQQTAGHEALEGESNTSSGVAVVAGAAGFAPLDLGRAGQVQCSTGGEVHEQECGLAVHGEVAEAVEDVVALVVRPPQGVSVSADEARGTAAVGGVRTPFRVDGPEEKVSEARIRSVSSGVSVTPRRTSPS